MSMRLLFCSSSNEVIAKLDNPPCVSHSICFNVLYLALKLTCIFIFSIAYLVILSSLHYNNANSDLNDESDVLIRYELCYVHNIFSLVCLSSFILTPYHLTLMNYISIIIYYLVLATIFPLSMAIT